MTIQNGANLYTQGFGSRPENVEIPFVTNRAPLTTDINYPVGKEWIDQATTPNTVYKLTSFSTVQGQVKANWVLFLTGSPGGQGIEFIDGDNGQATGTTVTFNANTNSGSTVEFNASGAGVNLVVTDGEGNTAVGFNAGKSGAEGGDNTFLGESAGHAINTGDNNTGLGVSSLLALTNGNDNSALGFSSLAAATTGFRNVALGSQSLILSNGNDNVAVGYKAAQNVTTGTDNIVVGTLAGTNYTGAESSNILIGSLGTLGESNAIRIGSPGSGTGQQNAFYVAGVSGISVPNTQAVTISTVTGQLGSMPLSGTLIQRLTASSSASLSFTSGINSSFTNYMIIFDNLIPAVAGTFDMQYSINGGTSYLNSGYNGGENSNPYNSATITNVNSANFFPISPSVDTTAGGGASGVIFLYGLTGTAVKQISGSGTCLSGGATKFSNIFGSQSTLSPVNAIQIVGDAGNIASGTVSLYGFN